MPLPQIKHCIVCEDVRAERRNLNSLMGVFGATPDVLIKLNGLTLPVGFCLIFFGGSASGNYNISAIISDANGTAVPSEITPSPIALTFQAENRATVFGCRVRATFPHWGVYTIRLINEGSEYFRDTINIEPATEQELASA